MEDVILFAARVLAKSLSPQRLCESCQDGFLLKRLPK